MAIGNQRCYACLEFESRGGEEPMPGLPQPGKSDTPTVNDLGMNVNGPLRDRFGRSLHYLRLSVTGRCNFRCVYCLPNGCPKEDARPLSLLEIERLVRGFAALGFWKVRVTGGEPTTRSDVCEIIRAIARTPGIRSVGLTTNGYRLAALAPALREAGLTTLNVSLDSLRAERFDRLTGRNCLPAVLEGIEAALAAGIPSVQVNTVLLRGLEDDELDQLLAWTKNLPLTVRFIELMQTSDNETFFRANHLPARDVRDKLQGRGWLPLLTRPGSGPAALYRHPDHLGRAGLIAPYSEGFCKSCNRLRVSSTGDLRLCLFGEQQLALRPYLRRDDQMPELERLVALAVQSKPAAHSLGEGRCGPSPNLAAIGG